MSPRVRKTDVFFNNFRDVIHDGILTLGFQKVTSDFTATIISDPRFKPTKAAAHKFDEVENSDETSYCRKYEDDVYGIISWDFRPSKGAIIRDYICNFRIMLAHPPSAFVMCELMNTTFEPIWPLVIHGILQDCNFHVNINQAPSALQALARYCLEVIKTEAMPFFDSQANQQSLESLVDGKRYLGLLDVCFYITANQSVKARGTMNLTVQKFAEQLKKVARNSSLEEATARNMQDEKRLRLSGSWIDNDIISRVDELTQS